MGKKEFRKIIDFFKEKNAKFKLIEHEPVFTSKQAASVRGADLSEGVKALVLKSNDSKFILACLPGDKKIDFKKLADLIGVKKLSLAPPSEVLNKTGCEVGSVSPIGVIYPLETFFDKNILEKDSVEFNVGMHTRSVRMNPKDLVEILNPRIEDFSI